MTEVDPELISFETVESMHFRVYYAGVFLYDARTSRNHRQDDLEQYRSISVHVVRDKIERMSAHERFDFLAKIREINPT